MGILRIVIPTMITAFLAGCAAHIPVYETQDGSLTTTTAVIGTQNDASTMTAQPDRTMTAKVNSETKKPKPPNRVTAATTVHKDAVTLTTKSDGSSEKLAKDRAEDERKERHIRQVIEGICRGC